MSWKPGRDYTDGVPEKWVSKIVWAKRSGCLLMNRVENIYEKIDYSVLSKDCNKPILQVFLLKTHQYFWPIGSTYGIFTYICHKNQPNVGKYTIHGSSGNISDGSCNVSFFLCATSQLVFHPENHFPFPDSLWLYRYTYITPDVPRRNKASTGGLIKGNQWLVSPKNKAGWLGGYIRAGDRLTILKTNMTSWKIT